MGYKWIIWGFVITLLSGAGWFVSVIFSVVTLGAFRFAANMFGYIAAAAIPVSVLLAVFDRKNK